MKMSCFLKLSIPGLLEGRTRNCGCEKQKANHLSRINMSTNCFEAAEMSTTISNGQSKINRAHLLNQYYIYIYVYRYMVGIGRVQLRKQMNAKNALAHGLASSLPLNIISQSSEYMMFLFSLSNWDYIPVSKWLVTMVASHS